MAVRWLFVEEGDRPSLESIRSLLREYGARLPKEALAEGLEEETRGLPGRYGPPAGALLLATEDAFPVGCGGIRPAAERSAELKRMYVRPAARGRGLGRTMAQRLIRKARDLGYRRIVLDTLPSMHSALRLYRSLGFRPIPPYWPSPVPGTLYFALELEER